MTDASLISREPCFCALPMCGGGFSLLSLGLLSTPDCPSVPVLLSDRACRPSRRVCVSVPLSLRRSQRLCVASLSLRQKNAKPFFIVPCPVGRSGCGILLCCPSARPARLRACPPDKQSGVRVGRKAGGQLVRPTSDSRYQDSCVLLVSTLREINNGFPSVGFGSTSVVVGGNLSRSHP